MQFIITGKRQGKTETLIEWASGNPERHIIVANYGERQYLLGKAGHRLTQDQVIPADEVRRCKKYNHEYAIDNLEFVLESWFGPIHIAHATGTQDSDA